MKRHFEQIILRFLLLGLVLTTPLGLGLARADEGDEPAVITAEFEIPGQPGKVKITIAGVSSDQRDVEAAVRMVNAATEDAPSTRVLTVAGDAASNQAYEVMLRLRQSTKPIERVEADAPEEFRTKSWVSSAWSRLVGGKLGESARKLKRRYDANQFNIWVGVARATLNGALGAASVWIAPATKLSNVTFEKALAVGGEMWVVGLLCQVYYDQLKWFMTTPYVRNRVFGVADGLEELENDYRREGVTPEERIALARAHIREKSADPRARAKLPTEDASTLRAIVERNLEIKATSAYRAADYGEVLLHWQIVEIVFAGIIKATMIQQQMISESAQAAVVDVVSAATQTMFAQGVWDAIIMKWEDQQKEKLRQTLGEDHPDYERRWRRIDRAAKVAMAINSVAATGIGLAGLLTGNNASIAFLWGMSTVGVVTYGAMAVKEYVSCSRTITNGPPAAPPAFQETVDADEQKLKEALRRHVG